jgi:hypothetical protein
MERKGSLFPSAHSQARSTIRAASQYLFSLNRPPHCPSRIKLHRASFCDSTLFPLGRLDRTFHLLQSPDRSFAYPSV